MTTSPFNIEAQIKEIFAIYGGPHNIEEWFNKPCPAFANKTPRTIIDSGNGNKLINKLKTIYRVKEDVQEPVAN
jgi:uncharacterized protein (DUF2384 family)